MAEKKERKVTPIGEAKWAHIQNPKPAFVENGVAKGAPKYQIDVLFEQSNPEWAAWAKAVMDRLKAMPEQVDKKTGTKIPKQTPIKRELDEHDQPTGRFYVTFKTNDKFKPGVFDLFGNQITALVGNGSKVRVSYTENEYPGFGGGINFYLNAVQVVELVEFQSQGAESYGFPIEQPNETDIPF